MTSMREPNERISRGIHAAKLDYHSPCPLHDCPLYQDRRVLLSHALTYVSPKAERQHIICAISDASSCTTICQVGGYTGQRRTCIQQREGRRDGQGLHHSVADCR